MVSIQLKIKNSTVHKILRKDNKNKMVLTYRYEKIVLGNSVRHIWECIIAHHIADLEFRQLKSVNIFIINYI